MVPASVGFQCPECVAAGQQGQRQPRTVLGGAVPGGGVAVTTVLLAVNVAVFVLDLLLDGRLKAEGASNPLFVAYGEPYRLLTAAFLHAGVIHLVVNMLALSQIGPPLESALGRARFLALYLLAALGGGAVSMLLSNPFTVGVGASGAIFGLFGAYYVVARRTGADAGGILVLLAINTVIGFTFPGIDWRAHLGGLVTGGALAAAWAAVPRGPRRTTVQVVVGVAILVIVVLVVVARALYLRYLGPLT